MKSLGTHFIFEYHAWLRFTCIFDARMVDYIRTHLEQMILHDITDYPKAVEVASTPARPAVNTTTTP